jgi:hypothetical protein
MRKENIIIGVVFLGLIFTGCSQKETLSKSLTSVSVSEKIEEHKTIEKESNGLTVEVKPVVDNKLEVVTKVKPEIAVVSTEKVKKGEIPIVVVDPVEEGTPVKEIDILPVVDDTVGVVAKVKPTIELIEEIPLEEDSTAVVIEPVVE